MEKKILYHGSSQIVDTPEIRIAKYNKDFYFGFYCFHCEPIEKVADDFIQRNNISIGEYDNVAECKYEVPDYWDIGEVFARLIEDCCEDRNVTDGIKEVYASWLADQILNFNSDLYYQSREYIALCYKEGEVLSA